MKSLAALLVVTLPTPALFAQATERWSVDASGNEGNAMSITLAPALSEDGRFVVFLSEATNLVPNDTNGFQDIFLVDRALGTIERVDVDSAGNQANFKSWLTAMVTPDGRYVTFVSRANNLVAGDTNAATDAFVRDRVTGITERVSVDSSGAQSNGGGYLAGVNPTISADGRFVAFDGWGDDLVAGDNNGTCDVFVHDRTTGTTVRVSVDSSGAQASGTSNQSMISADGRFVAFSSDAPDLVSGDSNSSWDVFVHDCTTGITERASVDLHGVQGNSYSEQPSISADGRFVAFMSDASNLVAGDTNGTSDVFVRDRVLGITERVSVNYFGHQATGISNQPSISSDGNRIAFGSDAPDLVTGDTNGTGDIFLRDRAAGTTERVSVDSSGQEATDDSGYAAISGNGRHVAFSSLATNLVANDANGVMDVFVHVDCGLATSTNYGNGVAGTFGVPSLTSTAPVLGAPITVTVDNSAHAPTLGLFFLGFHQAQLHTSFGGDLLLLPSLCVPIAFSSGPLALTATLPSDDLLCGVPVDLQVVEADPGAVKGVSFTAGLELILGR